MIGDVEYLSRSLEFWFLCGIQSGFRRDIWHLSLQHGLRGGTSSNHAADPDPQLLGRTAT